MKKITQCEHTNAKYYSKGLCSNCYHRFGRVKKATGCEHTDRKLYARKVCKACYLSLFHKTKIVKEIKSDEKPD